jgi:hypothetical protein
MDRVREISGMNVNELMEEMREDFGLEMEIFSHGAVCVSTEGLADAIPEWFSTYHCGWYKETVGGEFLVWARKFLMQEVCINVWIEYLKHKETSKLEAAAALMGGHFGNYV